MELDTIVVGDCLDVMASMPDGSVQCVVTSPPYWGLRDYGNPPRVWPFDSAQDRGGEAGCEHEWGVEKRGAAGRNDGGRDIGGRGGNYQEDGPHKSETSHGQFCRLCNAWRGCLGLEPTPELYVSHLVDIFREVKRVLRDDGTVWLNMGDSYCGSWGNAGHRAQLDGTPSHQRGRTSEYLHRKGWDNHRDRPPASYKQHGLKPKDLCGIPWRVAFALQADGWWLRSDIIWHKPNCMPESVRDRPTKAHEYVFLLSKSKRYYYDQDAVREGNQGTSWATAKRMRGEIEEQGAKARARADEDQAFVRGRPMNPAGRNRRTVWIVDDTLNDFVRFTIEQGVDIEALAEAFIEGQAEQKDVWKIATQPYSGAHFAVFPEKLIEPCIKAGTSQRGACPECGAGWVRVVERRRDDRPVRDGSKTKAVKEGSASAERRLGPNGWNLPQSNNVTFGWQPTCTCYNTAPLPKYPKQDKQETDEAYAKHIAPIQAERQCLLQEFALLVTQPSLVFDPFMGAGTTALVALKLGRHYYGSEINPDYVELASERIEKTQLRMAV